jgi:hypothetical protein
MNTVSQRSRMKENRKHFLLRMNEDLWNDLCEWASQEFRSVNGQIELVLQRAVNDWKKRKREEEDEVSR